MQTSRPAFPFACRKLAGKITNCIHMTAWHCNHKCELVVKYPDSQSHDNGVGRAAGMTSSNHHSFSTIAILNITEWVVINWILSVILKLFCIRDPITFYSWEHLQIFKCLPHTRNRQKMYPLPKERKNLKFQSYVSNIMCLLYTNATCTAMVWLDWHRGLFGKW